MDSAWGALQSAIEVGQRFPDPGIVAGEADGAVVVGQRHHDDGFAQGQGAKQGLHAGGVEGFLHAFETGAGQQNLTVIAFMRHQVRFQPPWVVTIGALQHHGRVGAFHKGLDAMTRSHAPHPHPRTHATTRTTPHAHVPPHG